jgi:hypothetical protein
MSLEYNVFIMNHVHKSNSEFRNLIATEVIEHLKFL